VTIAQLVAAIEAERARADALHPGTDRLPNGSNMGSGGRVTWMENAQRWCDRRQAEGVLAMVDVFDEEVSEVMACDPQDDEAIERELVQVMTVSWKWLREIRRRRAEREEGAA
jgi:hypothetical protein